MKWQSRCGRVTLYHADCRDVLPTLGKVDAVITDPPYGIGYFHSGGGGKTSTLVNEGSARAKSWNGKDSMIMHDDEPFDPRPMLGYKIVCLWGANHFSELLPKSSGWIVWDKIVTPETYGKFTFSDCEIAWTNRDSVARIYKHMWQGCRRMNDGEIKKNGKLHPNQKPVELMTWTMMELGVAEGMTVLDPYMGSGTTGIACIRTGRRFIGIEKDPAHFATAVERIKRELAQGDLFLSA